MHRVVVSGVQLVKSSMLKLNPEQILESDCKVNWQRKGIQNDLLVRNRPLKLELTQQFGR